MTDVLGGHLVDADAVIRHLIRFAEDAQGSLDQLLLRTLGKPRWARDRHDWHGSSPSFVPLRGTSRYRPGFANRRLDLDPLIVQDDDTGSESLRCGELHFH